MGPDKALCDDSVDFAGGCGLGGEACLGNSDLLRN